LPAPCCHNHEKPQSPSSRARAWRKFFGGGGMGMGGMFRGMRRPPSAQRYRLRLTLAQVS